MKQRTRFRMRIAALWAVAGVALAPPTSSGQQAPVAEPRLLAEGVISTSDDEAGITFTPDGKTVYFVLTSPGTLSPAVQAICFSQLVDGKWTTPEVAPFSGQYRDASPFISPDGSRFFFASTRPVDGRPKQDFDLWVMERTPDGWSEPRNLGAPVNTPANELGPCVTRNGTLYFAGIRPGGPGTYWIYQSRLVEGKYTEPESVGEPINSANGAIEPLVAPDESFLVFRTSGDPDEIVGVHAAYNQGDLYISYKKDGAWTKPVHLAAPINSGGYDGTPALSPDGKYFFFSSDRGFATYRLGQPLTYAELIRNLHSTLNGRRNLYFVDAGVLTGSRAREIPRKDR